MDPEEYAAFEATTHQINSIDNHPIDGIVNPMSNVVAVQEHINHGDTDKTRFIEVDLDDTESVRGMLNTCSYLRLPDPDFGKGAALVSRTYDEILADRRTDAERIAQELTDKGVAEIGWVEYRVMRRIHIPILQSKGWPADQINRCFA